MRRRAVCFAALAVAGGLAGCGQPQAPLAPPEPPTVTVARPVQKELATFREFTGYLRPAKVQEVRAQVSGYLKAVKFKDGQEVKAGDVLYEIDPRPYKAALDKAKADVLSAKAAGVKADADLERVKRLRAAGGEAISPEEYDRALSAKDAADATKQANAALLDKAQFDFDNCLIRTDTTGRVDKTLLTEGNYVTAGTTKLTTVTGITPMRAYWEVDEIASLDYRALVRNKLIPDPREGRPLRCWITLKDGTLAERAGVTDFIAPEIVRGTGTREIYGTFDNADRALSSGDSVRVRVEAGPSRQGIVIPETAVGSQQRQKFVYVVNDKDEAEFRPVELGEVRDGEQVVRSGVTPADRVITNGLLRVRPGVKVKPVEQPTPPTSTPATAKK